MKAPAPLTPEQKSAKPKAIVCLVLGIAAIVLSFIPLVNIISIVAGVVGIVLSLQAMKAIPAGVQGRGIAIAALVCCICGAAFGLCIDACCGCFMVILAPYAAVI